MIIAENKKKNNIAEYIIYMFQIEDLIRAHKFNLKAIEINIVEKFDVDNIIKEEMRIWYADLIEKMQKEKVSESGHLSFINEIIERLNEIHHKCIKSTNELAYIDLFDKAKPNIDELRNKSGNKNTNDINICLTGLYGTLLLKLKNQEIAPETTDAINTFSKLLGQLAVKYKSKFPY
jgi:hypothetical protein